MSSESATDSLWVWGKHDTAPRILHTMVRVGDLDRSLAFYCDTLGMRVLQKLELEEPRFSLVFLSFSDDYEHGAIELTYNWDIDHYDVGSGYGHVALGIPDIFSFCDRLKAQSVEFVTEPKIMIEGGPALAIIKDPDGYQIELIQTSKAHTAQLATDFNGC